MRRIWAKFASTVSVASTAKKDPYKHIVHLKSLSANLPTLASQIEVTIITPMDMTALMEQGLESLKTMNK